MSEQRKVSLVCSSSASFASFRAGEQQVPDRAGRALAEVSSSSSASERSFLFVSFPLFGFVPSFDLVLSAVPAEQAASYDGEESSIFEPEPVQGGTAAY